MWKSLWEIFKVSLYWFLPSNAHRLFFLFSQIESLDHCDFIPLRNMLIRTHLQDLKEVTNTVHYENYRCRKLAGVTGGAVDKIPNRV